MVQLAGNGGGITLPCTVPSDGREGRDRESIDLAQEQIVKQVFIKNPKTIVLLISSFPFAINWSAGECSRDRDHGAFLAG